MKHPDSSFLDGLNESQKQAVTATDGHLLIVAGPGTGKTLTIVRRIAHLVNQGVSPEKILAVTFTNRAAREMKERTESFLGRHSNNLFIGTFHLLGLKILKQFMQDDFVICDRDGQMNILKEILKGTKAKAHDAAERISRIKNFLEDRDAEINTVYEAYQSALAAKSALDFDDLILKPIDMFQDEAVLKQYQDMFSHIIVDEYQDINPAQYRLLKLLAGDKAYVCAVGDSDQAIYAFRGADIENFLNFEKDFKGAKTIALTQNYRSTGAILNASGSMIKNNLKRIEKNLTPAKNSGNSINIVSVPDERAEGEIIVKEIDARMGCTSHYNLYAKGASTVCEGSYGFSDFAVIFRTNAQANAVEEVFMESGIPYQVIGRKNLRQRKEIEDTISYMKSIIDPSGEAGKEQSASLEETLLSDDDLFDPKANTVTLMTMHMAKGLEFRVVFIAGAEDGLIPYTLNKDSADIEEERRLFYVGMTRAKDELFLLHSRSRFLYGQKLNQPASPFLKEIPKDLVHSMVVSDRMIKDKKKQIGLF
ncbi:MAG: UvrD-helicase domain-containing protein [Nitrospirae bacterium]|nr:UvrD-helicase domain-containing protein [Nitrospirota bacterium]MCL5978611.1 UvrD-helicase domain-containing protein [Nitrospirota bacterium]